MGKVTAECTQLRRMLVRSGTLNLTTGESTTDGSAWVTRPCGVPLFGDADRARGTCRACASGWSTPENMPAADGAPRHTFTPGPWETTVLSDGTEWGVCEAGGGDSVAWVEPTADPDVEQANARLIAEAPAMAEALEYLAGIALDTIVAATAGKTCTVGYVEIAQDRARAILTRIRGEG